MKTSLLLFILTYSILYSNEANVENKVLNYLNGPSNLGTEFWVTVPPPYLVADPQSYTRFFIASETDCKVRISSETGIDFFKLIKAGSIESFDLKPGECQPYVWQVGSKANPAQVYKGKALHITSDEPIVVYVVVRYQYTSDGYLAIPVDGLGKNYVATNYDARPYSGNSLPNMLCIVGTQDDTTVEFTLGGGQMEELEVETKSGKILKTGDNEICALNTGDVLIISNKGDSQTLSGTLIQSNKNIAVFSGNSCADVPINTSSCDYIVEQDAPIETWGNIYLVPSISNRKNPGIVRVFAKEDKTSVWRNGMMYTFLNKGLLNEGGTQNNSWMESRVFPLGFENAPAIFTSDKPISITFYNPGQKDDDVSSDPFSINLSSLDNYQNEIILTIPSVEGGRNFTNNFINIFFEVDENDQIPDDLMLGRLNTQTKNYDWVSVKEEFGSDLAYLFEIGKGDDKDALNQSKYLGRKYSNKRIQLDENNVYKLKSNKYFMVYSDGFDEYDSYGFPSAGMYKFNSNDTEKPVVEFELDCDGNVLGNTKEIGENLIGLITPKVDVQNSSNFSKLKIESNNFQPGDKEVYWKMNVKDKSIPAQSIIYFSDRSGNVSVDTISYSPTSINIPEPEISYEGELILCDSKESITLTLEDKGYSKYIWSTGESSTSIVINEAGVYNVKVFDENNCYLLSENINVLDFDDLNLRITSTDKIERICEGEEIQLVADYDLLKGSITWSTGETSKKIKVTKSGDYYFTIKVNDSDCEFISDVIGINFQELPDQPVIEYDNMQLKVDTESSKINWYLNNKLISKFSNLKLITPDIDGEYKCEIFDNVSNCSNISEPYKVNWLSVVNNMDKSNVFITPNPSNGNFNLKLEAEINGNVELIVYNINGQSIFEKDIMINSNSHNIEINIPKVSKGIYILNLRYGSKEINKKLIIE